jgi:hypothetical protein
MLAHLIARASDSAIGAIGSLLVRDDEITHREQGVAMPDNDSPDQEDQADGATTGAGTEAVQGTPESSTASSGVAGGKTAPGASRDRPHESGYGGRGGESKSSSDTREPNRPD